MELTGIAPRLAPGELRGPRPWSAGPASRTLPPLPGASPGPDGRTRGVGLQLYQIIKDHPGVHFRGLGRAAGLTSAGQLRHHLDRLVRRGLIVEVKDGRFSRYFATGDHEPRLRPELARFARPLPRQIGKLLLQSPLGRTELRRRLGCADSTLGYHLNRLVAAGDLERRPGRNGGQYCLSDTEGVRRALLMLQEGEKEPLPSGRPPEAAAPAPGLLASVPLGPSNNGTAAAQPPTAPAAPAQPAPLPRLSVPPTPPPL